MRLLAGSTSRWHVLHLAASSVLVDFLRLTLCEGCGRVGTNTTGLFTLRPDLVRVGSGVYESETSELSSSYSLSDGMILMMVMILATTNIVIVFFALRALALAASATASTSPTPTPSARTSPSRRTRWRCARFNLDHVRGAYAPTSSSADIIRDWWWGGQLVASNVVLKYLGPLGLECCTSRCMAAGSTLEPFQDGSCRWRELRETRRGSGAAVHWKGRHLG
jgi:hypothetical protein